MERAMKQAIMACAWAAMLTAAFAGDASAAIWRWGCTGPLGQNQIVSNRYQLLVIPGKPLQAKLYDLIFLDDLTKNQNIPEDDGDTENYNADDGNSGLVKKMTFTRNDQSNRKLTLTEKSSKRMSHRLVPGYRDEITDRFRKTYRYQAGNEPARDVTLACIDYLLTTHGGRSCN
jgi:hypothetical protein